MKATPARLRNGSWGARVHGDGAGHLVQAGQAVHVTARNGREWAAVVELVLWRGQRQHVSLVATGRRLDGDDAAEAARAHNWQHWETGRDTGSNWWACGDCRGTRKAHAKGCRRNR